MVEYHGKILAVSMVILTWYMYKDIGYLLEFTYSVFTKHQMIIPLKWLLWYLSLFLAVGGGLQGWIGLVLIFKEIVVVMRASGPSVMAEALLYDVLAGVRMVCMPVSKPSIAGVRMGSLSMTTLGRLMSQEAYY